VRSRIGRSTRQDLLDDFGYQRMALWPIIGEWRRLLSSSRTYHSLSPSRSMFAKAMAGFGKIQQAGGPGRGVRMPRMTSYGASYINFAVKSPFLL
jgi:hypothetical protein